MSCLLAYKNYNGKLVVTESSDNGIPSITGEKLYNEYNDLSSVIEYVSDIYSYTVENLSDIKCPGWSYVFIDNKWYVKHGEQNPFVPLTDYMYPFNGNNEFSHTPFCHRINVNHFSILFDTPLQSVYNAPQSLQGNAMELEDLLKQTSALFATFENEQTKLGCSLVVEALPYVYTWNSDTKTFDKDEFTET